MANSGAPPWRRHCRRSGRHGRRCRRCRRRRRRRPRRRRRRRHRLRCLIMTTLLLMMLMISVAMIMMKMRWWMVWRVHDDGLVINADSRCSSCLFSAGPEGSYSWWKVREVKSHHIFVKQKEMKLCSNAYYFRIGFPSCVCKLGWFVSALSNAQTKYVRGHGFASPGRAHAVPKHEFYTSRYTCAVVLGRIARIICAC